MIGLNTGKLILTTLLGFNLTVTALASDGTSMVSPTPDQERSTTAILAREASSFEANLAHHLKDLGEYLSSDSVRFQRETAVQLDRVREDLIARVRVELVEEGDRQLANLSRVYNQLISRLSETAENSRARLPGYADRMRSVFLQGMNKTIASLEQQTDVLRDQASRWINNTGTLSQGGDARHGESRPTP